jgi:CRP-like cAMP-binding protein
VVKKSDLKIIPLFEGLSPEDIEVFSKVIEVQEYKEGELIFNENRGGTSLYVINSGQVEISRIIQNEKKQTLTILYPPEFFGSLSFMDRKSHSATAVAQEAAEIFTLTRDDFNSLMEDHPLACYIIVHRIAKSIAGLVREMDQQYIDIVKFAYTGRT